MLPSSVVRKILLLTLLWLPVGAWADGVGKAIFVIGDVTLVTADGKSQALKKGQILNTGDRIDTTSKGQVQIRMIDGAFIGIRPNSSFEVSKYRFDETNPENQSSEFNLFKGGFRAITGKIGKTNKKAYKVVTPVATIGIRGTDYVAMYCTNDCDDRRRLRDGDKREPAKNGLYVGVLFGGVHVANKKDFIDIDRNQYTYVAGAEERPVRLQTPPAFLMFDITPTLEDEEHANRDHDRHPHRHGNDEEDNDGEGDVADGTTGGTTDPIVTTPPPDFSYVMPTDYRAFSYVNGADLSAGNAQAVEYANNGLEVHAFAGTSGSSTPTVYNQYLAQTLDLGYDAATGLSWGRWGNGTVALVNMNDGSVSYADLGNNSLHWISGPVEGAAPVLPVTGSATYTLIGNTSPTDNFGNSGVLGSASLNANFTTQTVDAQVNIGINNQVWNGSATGMAIGSGATFGGGMTVQASDLSTGSSATGTGGMTGTFVGPATASGAPLGAGTAYTLSADPNGVATTVTGVAAFEAQQ